MPRMTWPEDPDEACQAAERLALLEATDDAAAHQLRKFWNGRAGGRVGKTDPEAVADAIAAGKLDEASQGLAVLRVKEGLGAEWWALRLELSIRRGDAEGLRVALGREEILQALAVRSSRQLAELALARGDAASALTLTASGLTRTPDDAALHRFRLAALALAGDEAALLEGCEVALDRLDSNPGLKAVVELASASDQARRDRILARIEEKWGDRRLPRKVMQLAGRARFKGEEGEEASDLGGITAAAALARMRGEDAAAEALLAKLQTTGEAKDALVAQRAAAIRGLRPFEGLQRPLIDASGSEDAVKSQPGNSGITALVFCGSRNEVGVPIELFDGFLAQRGISAVYLSDRNHAAFMAGVTGLGADWKATNEALQHIVADFGTRRLVTIGRSAGGLGALSHGMALKAEGILIYSGVMTGDYAARAAMGEKRGRLIAHRAVKGMGPLAHGPTWFDETPHRPRIDLYFGEDMPADQRSAELLAGLPEVRLHPVTAPCGHQPPWRLLGEGRLGNTIDDLLAR